MRTLSLEEQDFCRRILEGNGANNYLGNIIDHRLANLSIEITRNPQNVDLFYQISAQMPTQIETENAIAKIDEISVLILTIVKLIKDLEDGGYIHLLKKANNNSNVRKFGRAASNMPYITNQFADPNISQMLIDYSEKEIYVTEEFKVFCENGFLARDERRFRSQIRTTTGILTVAIIALILNTGVFCYSLLTKTDGTDYDDLNTEISTLKKELNELKAEMPAANNVYKK
ncbi:hypothetical protein N8Z79_07435 [Crocinitomicaceae bacterium]|nr:hypothetical protein [Crocinitomicaceae bacterium]